MARAGGRPVMAGVDGSEDALRAVAWAAEEAVREVAPGLQVRLTAAEGFPVPALRARPAGRPRGRRIARW